MNERCNVNNTTYTIRNAQVCLICHAAHSNTLLVDQVHKANPRRCGRDHSDRHCLCSLPKVRCIAGIHLREINDRCVQPIKPLRYSKPADRMLAFCSTNVCSLSPLKLDILLAEVKDRSLDGMLLYETWHDADSVSIRRLRAEGFSVVERSRPRRSDASLKINHGGVAIVAAPGIHLTAVSIGSSPSTFECTAARFTSGQSSTLAIMVYRPGS